MILLTDQKVGGSSPSERAKHLRRSGPPNRLISQCTRAVRRRCGSRDLFETKCGIVYEYVFSRADQPDS